MLGISSQAVAYWSRAPAERVVQIEAVTGVARHLLRPDLYPAPE
jgi:DNA-binding transcriptional regulator YdaS (Cro superfamily)